MPTTILTSKGQMALPKEVRDRLGLRAGDRLEVTVKSDQITLVPMTLHLNDIESILPKPKRKVSAEEMNEAIAEAAAEESL